jgi:hypothetical protein
MTKPLVHNVKKFTITSNYGKDLSLMGEGGFSHILIFQSIFDYSVRVTFEMFDTGIRVEGKEETIATEELEEINLVTGEKVELVVVDENQVELDFTGPREFTVAEVITSGTNTMKEVHRIDLCTNDVVLNELEEKLVVSRFDQKIDATVNEVLSTITERPITIDPTLTELPIKGCTERPLDFVTMLCQKTQSEKFPESAGYLLFDTYNGLNFRSIDDMFSQEPKKKMLLTETPKLPPGYSNKILSVEFQNNVNVIDTLHRGSLQISKSRTLDPDTHIYGQTEHPSDALYLGDNNLSDAKPVVGTHLQLPEKTIGNIPHKLRNTGVHPTGPEINKQLESAQAPSFDHDLIPQIAAKRYYQAGLFRVNIKIDGDFEIFPGDVIHCDFPEIAARQKTKNLSDKKSGKYLVADVAHLIAPEGCYTKLNIIRDSIAE